MIAAMEFVWLPLDTWTVVIGALCALACALLGNFLVLRRMSLMGDAISHAVLPGLALAFLLSSSRASVTMLAGAAVIGVLTAVLTQFIHSVGKVDESAALGVVFSVLFAVGLVLYRMVDHVDLDPECVLYGQIEQAALNTLQIGPSGWEAPQSALVLAAVLAANAVFVTCFFKELRLAAFDPALAHALGFRPQLLHYALMTLVAITAVAAFESVGSILVIAMLIVPAAAAHLLTERLGAMIAVSLVIAVLSAGGGHLGAIFAPGWLGYSDISTSTAGMMSVVAGLLFLGALCFSPRHGLLARAWQRFRLRLRILREDVLGVLYRLDEAEREAPAALLAPLLRATFGTRPWFTRVALLGLIRSGLVRRAGITLRLTDAGRRAARDLVRSHRLWEVYLQKHLGLAADHLHQAAERLEHVTTPALRADLAHSTDEPESDPHGARIPRG